MNHDRERLLRYLEGDLPAAEAQDLRERLQRDQALRAQAERLGALRQILAAGTPTSFAPSFSERVLRRLSPTERPGASESLYDDRPL